MAVLSCGKPKDPTSAAWLGRCHPAVVRTGTFALILFSFTGVPSVNTAWAESYSLSEYEIKAGFLFNFTRFVQWPESVFANSTSPIVVGIVGDNPFGSMLTDTAVGKIVNGRPVQVRTLKESEDLRGCQIIFIVFTDKKRIVQMLGKLKGYSVLTVGEGSGFAQLGGMIGFLVEGRKVRLEVDLTAASEARLKISAKVIALARLVSGEPREKY